MIPQLTNAEWFYSNGTKKSLFEGCLLGAGHGDGWASWFRNGNGEGNGIRKRCCGLLSRSPSSGLGNESDSVKAVK